MLFSCLKSHAQRPIIFSIDAYADNATWHCSLEIIFCRKKCSVWSAIPQWYAKALSRTNRNISTQLTRRSQQCQCKKICCHGHITPSAMNGANEITIVFNGAKVVWILNDSA